jgi:heterotetrameric sarcosine oxidase delta subunit
LGTDGKEHPLIQLTCPNCGLRNVDEFHVGGEVQRRPDVQAEGSDAWMDYLYLQRNRLGFEAHWWHHHAGCGVWFIVRRHTKSQVVEATYRMSREDGVYG